MQIVIEIDIEGIVREEIRSWVRENIVINNSVNAHVRPAIVKDIGAGAMLVSTDTPEPKETGEVDYEFAPGCTPRRSPEQIAFHKLELQYGRRLTPAEKGETEATLEAESEAQEKAKIAAKDRIRIDGYVADAEKELEKESAEQNKAVAAEPAKPTQTSIFDEKEPAEPANIPLVAPSKNDGPTVPETDKLEDISRLFN